MAIEKEITVLAVSRMEGGICVAGRTDDGEWIRPIDKESNNLSWEYVHKASIFIGSKITIPLLRPAGSGVHSEDWIISKKKRPTKILDLDDEDYLAVLSSADESESVKNGSIKDYLRRRKRSLMIIKPDSIDTVCWGWRRGQIRIKFKFRGEDYNISCTDINFGKFWKAFYPNLKAGEETLQKRKVYLTVGLSRLFKGRYYGLIVGVHAFPRHYKIVNNKFITWLG